MEGLQDLLSLNGIQREKQMTEREREKEKGKNDREKESLYVISMGGPVVLGLCP